MRCADDERTRRTETIYACSTHAGAEPRTRGWNEVREKGNVIGSVRRLGSLAKGRFLDSERRDRRPRERARETGRGYKRGYKREGSFVRSFVCIASAQKNRKTGGRGSRLPLFLSLSPSISIRPRSMGYAIERRSKIDPRADEGRDLVVRRRRVRSNPRA